MSRKKAHKFISHIFASNISILADFNGGKYAFADSLGVSYESVRRWCTGENLPDGKQLLAIQEKFDVSIDWLLNGKSPVPVKFSDIEKSRAMAEEAFLARLPEELKKAFNQVKEVLLSDHPLIKPVLLSNLDVYQHCVKTDKPRRKNDKLTDDEIQRLRGRIQFLEEWQKAGGLTGTDAAASSSTGRSKT